MFLLFGLGARLSIKRRRHAALLERARAILLSALDQPASPDDIAWLRSIPIVVQFRLFEEVAPSLRGLALLRVRRLALGIDLIERARASCKSRRWWMRLRGARAHTLLGGGETEVPPLFNDRIPEVRAQAAEWAAEHPSPLVISELLRLLDDEEQVARFTVEDSLIRLGGAAVPALAEYLESGRPGLEGALRVARFGPDPRYLPGALTASRSLVPSVRSGSALLLGALGGPEAASRVTELINDPDEAVRTAAIAGAAQMDHWPAASVIAERLTDRAWDVRRSAGMTLRAFGAPGTLFLRKALNSEDRFAADMARHVLGLPGYGSTGSSL